MDCWEVTGTWVNTKSAVVSPAKKKVTLIGYYCINPSCILQSESVNGTNARRK
ncbi:unnamed protein product, partial [Brassica oleracea]